MSSESGSFGEALPEPSKRLLALIKAEQAGEREQEWSRLRRIPDTGVRQHLAVFDRLRGAALESYLDFLAVYVCSEHSAMFGLTPINYRAHPFFDRGSREVNQHVGLGFIGVPGLRGLPAAHQDLTRRGLPSPFSEDLVRYANSIRSVKAPELRKRVKAALPAAGLDRTEKDGGGNWRYHCANRDGPFLVRIDYGSRLAQLRYEVDRPDLCSAFGGRFSFERLLGVGFGYWDLVTTENVDNAMSLLADLVGYASALPSRILEAIGSTKSVRGKLIVETVDQGRADLELTGRLQSGCLTPGMHLHQGPNERPGYLIVSAAPSPVSRGLVRLALKPPATGAADWLRPGALVTVRDD